MVGEHGYVIDGRLGPQVIAGRWVRHATPIKAAAQVIA
jgi:hypothetical protein